MYEKVPIELKQLPQQVCWRLVQKSGRPKPDKIPINPITGFDAKSNDNTTWGTFGQAQEGIQKYDCAGVGIMFGNGIFGVDIDHCFKGSVLSDEATDAVEIMNSYTELSPSRTGIHILAFGNKPSGKCRNGPIEMYDTGRFFTVTGEDLDSRKIRDCTEAAEIVYKKFIKPPISVTRPQQKTPDFRWCSSRGSKQIL